MTPTAPAPFTFRPDVPGRFVQFALPLPRGLWTWSPGVTPVRVYDGDRELVAQVERIMRHRDGSAASVMVYADAGPGAVPASVRVEWEPHREGAQREFEYHEEIRRQRRQFSMYTNRRRTAMSGPVVHQIRETLAGQETWITFFHDSPAVRFDALCHNGQPGAQEMAIRSFLEIPLPEGWEFSWTIVEPLADATKPIYSHGTAFFGQRALRIVRAVLAPRGYQGWTEAHPAHGWATVPHLWQTTWAWAPHFIPCPDLSWRTSLAAEQSRAYGEIRSAIANGTQYPPTGNYPMAVRHGFFHPQGSQEGGMTSGSGITYGPAGDIVQTGQHEALMRAFYEQRMWRDRDRTGCISASGEPITYEDVKAEIDSGKIRFSADDPGRFDKQGSVTLDGSLNWSKQIPAPASAERTALLSFEAVDWAHRIRATYWDLALLQLANDPISRFLVRQDGELARMAWHSGGRQKGDVAASQAGLGLPRDRILGWQLHAMAAAYEAGNNALRERFKSDMASASGVLYQAVQHGPTLCALTSGKQTEFAPYNKLYAVCVAIQEGLLTQGFLAVRRASGIDRGAPLAHVLRAVRFLLRGQQTVWSAAVWAKADRQPFTVRRDDLDSHLWAQGAYDSEQTRALPALVALIQHEAGEDTSEAVGLMTAMLGASPKAALRKMHSGALDSDSICVAACDRLGLP